MTGRSTEEWIGSSPDAKAPPRVRLRVFFRDDGRCMCGCNRRILVTEKWETDHTVPIIAGGENRESNLRTLLSEHHKEKTKTDVAEKSKVARIAKKHLGLAKPRRTMGGKRFNGDPIFPRARP